MSDGSDYLDYGPVNDSSYYTDYTPSIDFGPINDPSYYGYLDSSSIPSIDLSGAIQNLSSSDIGSNLLQQLVSPDYGQSMAAWAQNPMSTGLLSNPLFRPDQSFVLGDGTVVGSLDSGADIPNPYHYVDSNGSTFIVDENTGQTVGYLGEDGQPRSYQEDRLVNMGKPADTRSSSGGAGKASTGSFQKLLDAMSAKQLAQMEAQDKYANSKAGQVGNAAAAGLAIAKALFGKNQGATTTSRSNQGQAFAPTYQKATAPKTKYASGGTIEGKGGLLHLAEQLAHQIASQKGLISGQAGGQDDVVDIKAAPGEYVMDADVVSALGDGNNDEGARRLDHMRMNIRKHKRTGGLASIPPKAKAPEQYLKGK